MGFEATPIKDLLVFEPNVFGDERGYFFESYNRKSFEEEGLEYDFVQDNESFSRYGTVRGIHLQLGNHAQAKLVRVVQGTVLDVAVDLRPNSKTFGKWHSIELSAENHKQLLIPRGFGHGFSVLSESAIFQYKVDNYYSKESEAGIIFNDVELNIDWRIPSEKIIVSDKDKNLGSFANLKERLCK